MLLQFCRVTINFILCEQRIYHIPLDVIYIQPPVIKVYVSFMNTSKAKKKTIGSFNFAACHYILFYRNTPCQGVLPLQ